MPLRLMVTPDNARLARVQSGTAIEEFPSTIGKRALRSAGGLPKIGARAEAHEPAVNPT